MKSPHMHRLNTYQFHNQWTLECPIEMTWNVLTDTRHWDGLFSDVLCITAPVPVVPPEKGRIYTTRWKGKLPYTLSLIVRITDIKAYSRLSVSTEGDLDGSGTICFEPDNTATLVSFTWQARPTRLWMRLLAPVARRFFIHNHNTLLDHGYTRVSHYLKASATGTHPC